jgi:hypothetical protein
MHLNRRLLGWGLFFIVLGLVPLAVRAGVVDPDLVGRWPLLWPLLLIASGIGLVLRRTAVGWIGGALAAVTLGLMGGGAIATGFGNVPAFSGCGSSAAAAAGGSTHGTFTGPATVGIEFDCGSIAIGTVDGADWTVTGSDLGGRVPAVVSSDANAVELRRPGGATGFLGIGRDRATWDVSLPRSPALGLSLTLNAGDGSLDLQGATLSGLSLTVNAGSLQVDAGGARSLPTDSFSAMVNAGSATIRAPAFNGTLNLSLNAGSLDVCLPAGAAVRVDWSGTLASNDLDSLGLVKVDDHTWTTSQFDATRDHVVLRVSANAGSFGLKIGDSCHA